MKQETDDDEQLTKLGHFIYDIKSNHALQTFPVKAADGTLFSFVLLQILSNHGHDAYTCLYRFRVHGKEIE